MYRRGSSRLSQWVLHLEQRAAVGDQIAVSNGLTLARAFHGASQQPLGVQAAFWQRMATSISGPGGKPLVGVATGARASAALLPRTRSCRRGATTRGTHAARPWPRVLQPAVRRLRARKHLIGAARAAMGELGDLAPAAAAMEAAARMV